MSCVSEKAFIIHKCFGFVWQDFGSGGATGVSSKRSCQKLPLCPTEPMPAGSKADPPLAKAEPVRDGGSTSVIMYLKKGKKKPAAQQQMKERSENM